MTNLAFMEVQHALYTKLSGDGVLMGMVDGIYDVVPQQSALPYIVLGDGSGALLPADGVSVTECRLTLSVWTEAHGRKTAMTILNRLHALLHLGALTMDGFALVILRVEQAETELRERGTRIRAQLILQATVVEEEA